MHKSGGGAPNRTEAVDLEATGGSHLPAILGGIGGAALGTLASGWAVTTATTGMWWWISTQAVSLATLLAGVVGVSVSVVTGGLAIVGCIVGVVLVNKAVAGFMRKRVRNRILGDF